MARARKPKGAVKVNFKGVESRKTPAEGDYILEILEATSGQSQGGNDQIEFVLEIAEGEFKGTKVWFYCPLAENSLWKLHAFLTALGVDVPEDEFEIDLPELVGKQIVGVITHETYQGKKKAKMTDFDSVENFEGAGDKKKGKKADKADEPEDKPKDKKAGKDKKADKKPKKIAEADVDEMDEDELEELVEKNKLKVDLDDIKKLPKKRAAVVKALKKADLLDD